MSSIENTLSDGITISSDTSSVPPSSNPTSASAISTDQLMDYIKKQKQKIKTLEIKLQKYELNLSSKKLLSNEITPDTLFWEFLSKQSLFHQRLAKKAISSMIYIFENSKLGLYFLPTKKNLFNRWKEQCIQYKLSMMMTLEQKNIKLKALLARTYSINQKNIEDSNLLKQRQQDALIELKSLKEKEESERQVNLSISYTLPYYKPLY